MKKIFALIFFASYTLASFAQCSELSVSVSASDTTYIQLYHAGYFLIPSGFENICEWEVTKFNGDVIFQDTTSGDAFEQGQVLFDHDVPIADSMKVTLVITNNIEGIVCTINDTLFWEETEVLPGSFIGNWAILSDNGGVESEIASFTEYGLGNDELLLFPSPVGEYFQIEGPKDIYIVTIFDLNGRVVQMYNAVQNGEIVDVSGIPSGTYLVQCRSNANSNLTFRKMIKN